MALQVDNYKAELDLEIASSQIRQQKAIEQLKEQLLKDQSLHFSKIQQQKGEFITTVNRNIRALENLVEDYSARTHEQITKTLNDEISKDFISLPHQTMLT